MNERDEKLDGFEQELMLAMKRVEAPKRLAESVMRAVEAPRKARVFAFPRIPVWATGAVAAMLVIGALVTGQMHERREHRQIEADRKFETATQITDRALDHARRQLAEAGIQIED